MTTVKSYSTTNIQTLFNDESSYSYSYSFEYVSPNIVGIHIDNIKFNNIDTKVMDIYDDLFLVFSIKGEIENGKNLSDMYFLAEEKDYFFNITLKSDVDISKIEFVTQLCYKPSPKKSGCNYCSFIENSKNTECAFYSKNISKNSTLQINEDDKDDNLAAEADALPCADDKGVNGNKDVV